MNDLLKEYKNQLEKECKELNKIDLQINNLDKNMDDYDLQYNKLKSNRNDIEYYKFNLSYVYKWLESGHEPGSNYTGIDNRYKAWNKNGYLIEDEKGIVNELEDEFDF
jgi:hypothetical protein